MTIQWHGGGAWFAAMLLFGVAGAATAQDGRGLCNRDGLDPRTRIPACTQVIQTGQGDLAWAYNNRGADYARQGAEKYALADLDEAIRRNPNYIAALNNRCYVRAVLGQVEAAIADCDRSLALMPNDYRTLDSRGLANLMAGRPQRAIVDYSAALKLNGQIAASLFGRGKAKLMLGQTDGIADIQKARQVNPRIDAEMARLGVRL